jgi:hypothetical protein
VEAAIDSRSILCKADRTSFLVATPDLPQRRKLCAFQGRFRAGGAKDHVNIVAAGAIDGVP